jgi:hypothetical protein
MNHDPRIRRHGHVVFDTPLPGNLDLRCGPKAKESIPLTESDLARIKTCREAPRKNYRPHLKYRV